MIQTGLQDKERLVPRNFARWKLLASAMLGLTTATRSHVVIIVAIGGRLLGLLVDAVSDILTVNSSDIRPVPDVDQPIDNAFLAGIIPVGDSMVVLLSLENLFANHGPASTAVAA